VVAPSEAPALAGDHVRCASDSLGAMLLCPASALRLVLRASRAQSRDGGARRRAALALLALLVWPAVRLSAQSLTVDTVGEALRIRAPGFSFMQGDPLTRLRDGRTVRVELAALVLPGPGKPPGAAARRVFALSYDLWEERFAVTQVGAPSRSAAYLTSAAAEAWCLEQLTVPVSALGRLGRDLPFWIRLDSRVLTADTAPAPDGGDFSLRGLIDALSRRRKNDALTHSIEAGPFRLSQ
jgi:hypothetical protein